MLLKTYTTLITTLAILDAALAHPIPDSVRITTTPNGPPPDWANRQKRDEPDPGPGFGHEWGKRGDDPGSVRITGEGEEGSEWSKRDKKVRSVRITAGEEGTCGTCA